MKAAFDFARPGNEDRWWAELIPKLHPETLCRTNEPLAPKTTFRVGGPARFYAEPASIGDLRALWCSAREAGVSVFFLGRGSNLIVADTGFPGLVLRLRHHFWRSIEMGPTSIRARAGAGLKQICMGAAKQGLAGFEFLEGIPGSLGGALRMNAGAMGGWIFDVVGSVEFMTPDGAVQQWPRERFHAEYRQCRELLDSVALGAVLRPVGKGEAPAIREQIDAYATIRKSSQPRGASAGCIFKNPEGGHAGKMIDELGLKGEGVGGVRVSTVHGNFIVNENQGSCADTVGLIRTIRERVRSERGVELEPEVLLLGARWEDLLS